MIVKGRLRIATGIALLCISKLILDGPPLLHAPFWYSLRGRYAIWKNLQALKLFPYYPSSTVKSNSAVYLVSITHTDTTTTNRKQRKRNESPANKET